MQADVKRPFRRIVAGAKEPFPGRPDRKHEAEAAK